MAQSFFFAGRFLRWSVALVSLVTLLAFLGLPPEETTLHSVVMRLLQGLLVLLILAMVAPYRFVWAGRMLCGLVFVAYLLYLADELWQDPGGLLRQPGRSDASALNALLGTIVIGLPCLTYGLRGPRTYDPDEDPEGGEAAPDARSDDRDAA